MCIRLCLRFEKLVDCLTNPKQEEHRGRGMSRGKDDADSHLSRLRRMPDPCAAAAAAAQRPKTRGGFEQPQAAAAASDSDTSASPLSPGLDRCQTGSAGARCRTSQGACTAAERDAATDFDPDATGSGCTPPPGCRLKGGPAAPGRQAQAHSLLETRRPRPMAVGNLLIDGSSPREASLSGPPSTSATSPAAAATPAAAAANGKPGASGVQAADDTSLSQYHSLFDPLVASPSELRKRRLRKPRDKSEKKKSKRKAGSAKKPRRTPSSARPAPGSSAAAASPRPEAGAGDRKKRKPSPSEPVQGPPPGDRTRRKPSHSPPKRCPATPSPSEPLQSPPAGDRARKRGGGGVRRGRDKSAEDLPLKSHDSLTHGALAALKRGPGKVADALPQSGGLGSPGTGGAGAYRAGAVLSPSALSAQHGEGASFERFSSWSVLYRDETAYAATASQPSMASSWAASPQHCTSPGAADLSPPQTTPRFALQQQQQKPAKSRPSAPGAAAVGPYRAWVDARSSAAAPKDPHRPCTVSSAPFSPGAKDPPASSCNNNSSSSSSGNTGTALAGDGSRPQSSSPAERPGGSDDDNDAVAPLEVSFRSPEDCHFQCPKPRDAFKLAAAEQAGSAFGDDSARPAGPDADGPDPFCEWALRSTKAAHHRASGSQRPEREASRENSGARGVRPRHRGAAKADAGKTRGCGGGGGGGPAPGKQGGGADMVHLLKAFFDGDEVEALASELGGPPGDAGGRPPPTAAGRSQFAEITEDGDSEFAQCKLVDCISSSSSSRGSEDDEDGPRSRTLQGAADGASAAHSPSSQATPPSDQSTSAPQRCKVLAWRSKVT
ncbi:hypothetical protein DIPPA_28948 [Diplonema papillatum]|nr:hypothetical protein DIPPA_28948 [Diplonema papillatum]